MKLIQKQRPKLYFFLSFGTGGTVAYTIIYTLSKYSDAIPTPYLHPLLRILIWWIAAAIVVPFMPNQNQPTQPK